MENTAKIIQEEITGKGSDSLQYYASLLYNNTRYYDSIWTNQNDTNFHVKFDSVSASMKTAYFASIRIDSLSAATNLLTSADFQAALKNVQYWYKGSLGEEGMRDRFMANMVIQFSKRNNMKLIVWAHAVHLALQSPFDDKSVGGTGGYIKKQNPGYYSLGLGTTTGTFSATTDRFDTRINKMNPYPLTPVKAGTWDEVMEKIKFTSFFIPLDKIKKALPKLPLRVVGYGPGTEDYSDKNELNTLFDGYIFIRNTMAADHQL